MDKNCEVAENKVSVARSVSSLEENKGNLVFLCPTLLIKFGNYNNLRCADSEEKFLKRKYLKQNQLVVYCVALE